MSYGADFNDLRRAAIYIDKILKGVKPADLAMNLVAHFLGTAAAPPE